MPTRNSKSPLPHIDLRNISREDLTDDRRFEALYKGYVSRKLWPNDYINFLEFASYAEKALQEDRRDTPGRLFAALIRQNQKRISLDQEDRAKLRFPTGRIETIVEAIREPWLQDLVDPEPSPLVDRNIGFLPAAAAQCFLPQKRLPDGQILWTVSHGNTTLSINATSIVDRNAPGVVRQTEVPYGRLARILFAYVIGQSVKTKSPTIDMGTSLRNFMARLGISYDGRAGKKLTDAVEDFAAAQFMIGHWGDRYAGARYARVVDTVEFWLEPDDGQRTFWTPELTLSDKFYEQVQAHQVPIDMDHLAALRSPRRMDFYVFLAYRTGLIPRRRVVRIPLPELQPILAPDISESRAFKRRLREDLRAIAKIYPHFNAEIQDDFLALRWSSSPIPRRSQVTSA